MRTKAINSGQTAVVACLRICELLCLRDLYGAIVESQFSQQSVIMSRITRSHASCDVISLIANHFFVSKLISKVSAN